MVERVAYKWTSVGCIITGSAESRCVGDDRGYNIEI